jgi:hypothetical protein
MDTLNKPLKEVAIRTAWLSLGDLLLVGLFIALVIVVSENFRGSNADTVLYLATAIFFITQLMFVYVAFIWDIQVSEG